jgi:hypothetical protein
MVGDLARKPRREGGKESTTAWFEVNELGIGLEERVGEIMYFATIEVQAERIELAGVRIYDEIEPARYGQSEVRLIDSRLYDTRLIRALHIGRVLCTARHPNVDAPQEILAVLPTKYC